jgi:hypothetical protein
VRKCGAAGLDGGLTAQGALGSIACERLSVGLHVRARARARGQPPGGDRAHSEVRSKVHENCRLWASCPLPPPTACDARFRFRTRRAVISFSFPSPSRAFLAFGSPSAARICPAPIVENWGIGAPGDGTGRSKAFCVFDENKCSHQCRVHVRGERGRKGNCAVPLSHGKKKRKLERKRKKKIHYRAP